MQFQIHENDDSCQPSPQYSNPRIVVREHHGAPLLNWSGLVLVRQLIERLGIVSAIDRSLRLLRRCKWYRESDHILTLIYNILGGGNTLQDGERLRQDEALKRVLGRWGSLDKRSRRCVSAVCRTAWRLRWYAASGAASGLRCWMARERHGWSPSPVATRRQGGRGGPCICCAMS